MKKGDFLKKAQGGLNAAILMAVIGGLIIAYVIFLPSDEREALLENKTVEDVRRGSGGSDSAHRELLLEFPGRLDTVEEVDDKQIPNVFLYETTNAKELATINPFIVRSGWFDKKNKVESFSISDLGNTDNILLALSIKKGQGVLTIMLNGNSIYESEVTGNVDPIRIPRGLLQDQNTLRFSVSSVGFSFWTTNEYQFDTVRLIADVTDKSNQESRSVFTVTDTELYNLEEANLRFVPYCANAGSVGTLDVSINSRNVFSAIPVCEDAYKQPLPIGLLKEGQNTITMKTSKGSYSVEQIRIEFDEEDIKSNVYFFELNETHIEDIKDEGDNVILTLQFVEDDKLKRADINVNDRFFTLDQEERTYTEDITDEIEKGNNFVEIIPRNTIDVREVRVTLEND